jgi:uncharacterized protein
MRITNRAREWTLISLVVVTAILANLPEAWLSEYSINRNYMLGILGAVVFLALFWYLKFQSLFLIVMLALGSNLPASVLESVGISRWPLVISLALVVGIVLINYLVNLMPTGLEPVEKEKSKEGIAALFYAIEKGNVVYAQKILSMNFDPNLVAENGYTPLMYAAARGDMKMVELLLRNGANVNMISKEGDTAIELALKTGGTAVADMLKAARAEQLAREQAMKAAQARAAA